MALKHKMSRIWFYFRAGYGFYFVFLISGMNALMIAYFIVLGSVECQDGQTLESTGKYICAIRWFFPTFGHFVGGAIVIGAPMLITVGYFHYKKNQYGTHAHVNWRTNPYQKVTLSALMEIINELKETSVDKERRERIETIENKLKDFLGDKRLNDDGDDQLFKNF